MRIKGFDGNLRCRGMQFEVGNEYKIENEGKKLELCSNTVFHYCDSLQKVHEHYSCSIETNRFCEIEVLGEEVTDGWKCGSDHIRIVREITGEELQQLKGMINGNTGLFNSGYKNSGNRNSGNRNSGYRNSGDWNSGDWNSGVFNSCNFSNGVFCNKEDMDIRIFNMPSGMSMRDFYRSKYWGAMCSVDFPLTEWAEYTEEEKQADEKKALIGGYLKKNTYQYACARWWEDMSEENREIIMSMPNFDAEVFKDITGIEV